MSFCGVSHRVSFWLYRWSSKRVINMWIKDYINKAPNVPWIFEFYEKLSVESLWFSEKYNSMIPSDYQERREATMLEF